ncbi:uncharacterized protein [Littorina saxatilis]|uniref:uncharacterized protein n=1 Tax=Littorina saxatilis TaxID=31220 RepID=UPI0038B61613
MGRMGSSFALAVALCLLCTCAVLVTSSDNGTGVCNPPNITGEEKTGKLVQVLDKSQAALLLLLGFGGFSVLLAILYISIRRYVFRDADNLNTTFDAGGRVSMSLTAVTVASQLLWPGDLLQAATVTIKNGVAGSFWYSTAAVINMILFPMLSVQFKTRAPGAKTFLQVIHARFGNLAHVVFCSFALLLNLVVINCLITASVALLQSLIRDASDEYCVMIMATLFGSYSFVGGLGSTFYVSYFNAAVIFCLLATFIGQVFYSPDGSIEGGFTGLYNRVKCLPGPEGNEERSYLTFWSEGAVIWAVQGFFATASITFCDQASWQSRIAAKPKQGVLGFFVATYMWFAIPSTIGTSVGLAYLDASSRNASLALSVAEIDAGLVTPFMSQHELGVAGSYMILTMLIMSLMSTGSGEVMAVSSIIVYDVYQTHIRPFRRKLTLGHCALCGLAKSTEVTTDVTSDNKGTHDVCQCVNAEECQQCQDDVERIATSHSPSGQKVYRCSVHGEYRMYQDSLMQLKSWVILWVTTGLVPLGLVVIATGVDLNWLMLCGFILTVPCFPGALMSIIWVKTTAIAVVVGSLSGLVAGLIANLSFASTYEGGLGNFLPNTSENYAVLTGSCCAFGFSLVLTFVVSLFTHRIRSSQDELLEWQRMRDIDNPLYPWALTYRDDFPHLRPGTLPTYQELDTVFRGAKLMAYIGGSISIALFIVIIPCVMMPMHVLSEGQFRGWVIALQFWCFFMAIVVIVVVPVEEIVTIVRQLRLNAQTSGVHPEVGATAGGNGKKEGGGGFGGQDGLAMVSGRTNSVALGGSTAFSSAAEEQDPLNTQM